MAAPDRVIKPDPDPTLLTTESLLREIKHSNEHTETLISEIRTKIKSGEKLNKERFKAIANRFRERDVGKHQADKASSDAIVAALTGLKELTAQQAASTAAAATKTESAFSDQLKGLANLVGEKGKATDEKISQAQTAIQANQAAIQALLGTRTGADKLWGYILGAIGVAALLFSTFHNLGTAPSSPQPVIIQSPAFEAPKAP